MSVSTDQHHAGGSATGSDPVEGISIVEIEHKAKENLKSYIIKGIINEEFIPCFFSSIQKTPIALGIGAAAVTMTENGIRLLYDIHFFAEASKEKIDFTLSHELMHILNYHFIRSDEMMAEYDIALSEFNTKFIPFADLPVNYSIKDLDGYIEMKDNMMIYDQVSELDYSSHPTFESIVKFILTNPDKEQNLLKQMGIGDGTCIVQINEDGSTDTISPGTPEGKVVTVPEVTTEGKRESEKDLVDLIKSSSNMAGNTSYSINQAISKFLDEYNNKVIKGWELLEHMLVGERAINKGTERAYSRLNRRTMRLPGQRKLKGFSAMFIVDESGSMSDEEINLAFTMVKKVILRENNDKVYVVHWDTEPVGTVDELQYESDMDTLERRKSGGTDFKDFFTNEIFHRNEYDLYVCVTDGYPYHWPMAEADKPVVWVITQSGGYDEWKNNYKKGIGINIDEA